MRIGGVRDRVAGCFGEMTSIVVGMNRQMTATQAKSQLLSLLNDVAGGDEIEITKHGRTVARLVPAVGPAALRGQFAGIAASVDDDELLFATGEAWESS